VLLGGTLKPRSASENCYINSQAHVDEMHNHDTKDHTGEQSLTHRIVARSVCAFGPGGERANTRTLQVENNTCIMLNKIQLQNVSYYTVQNFTITSITKNKRIQIRTWIGLQRNHFIFTCVPYCAVASPFYGYMYCTDRRSRREIKGFPARRKDSTRGTGVTYIVSVRRPHRCYS
jgi:hypothetical protein